MKEYWDILDVNGKKLGYQKSTGELFLDGEYHLGASLWIARADGQLLIQKRALCKEVGPGLWSITGGKVWAGESSTQACLREVSEELGIALKEQNIHFLYRSVGVHLLYDDYITVINFPLRKVRLSSLEVSEIKWASVDEILNLYANKKFLYNQISDLSKVSDYLASYNFRV